ncbi:MAG: diaminopimelate decarboxylase [Planctomycetia bacterium]|nr:diaminopimelate decarboxylase [Planctomycetia bacterium]
MPQIAGVSVRQIAADFGTPTFVYDEALILKRYEDLAKFDVVRYAQKACGNIAILKSLREAGARVDAVSGMEIRRAMCAGYQVNETCVKGVPELVYVADIFDRDALQLCVREHVHVNCGSLDMISQLGEAAPGREITLRINPGFGHGHSQKTNTGGPLSKHGIWWAQLEEAKQLAAKYSLRITGLHMHIGSGTDLAHLSECCVAMKKFALQTGDSVKVISAGGGLPTVYKPQDSYVDLDKYFALWDNTRKELEAAFGHPVTLEIEPGRYLVAESGTLITEIRAVKKQDKNIFYLLDAGFNNLARPVLYGSFHPMAICPAEETELQREFVMQDVTVGGPLCESGDIFTQEEGGYVITRSLPEAKVGDYLLIACTGAYGFVMGSNYNSKTFAAEVLLKDGQCICIRKRQNFEQLIENEIY